MLSIYELALNFCRLVNGSAVSAKNEKKKKINKIKKALDEVVILNYLTSIL